MFYNTFFVKKIWWYKKKVVTLRGFYSSYLKGGSVKTINRQYSVV